MEVETYEVEEIQGELGNMAADAEAQELIAKLGLTGQQKLLDPETCTRNPYRVMTKHEMLVYRAIMEHKTPLESYSDDTIPLRVLQVAAHAKETGLFKTLEVWHAEPAVLRDDPILVGHVETAPGERKLHLLARWGKALMPFDQLEKLAVDVAKSKRLAELRSVHEQVERLIASTASALTIRELSRTTSFYDYEG